MQKQKLERLEKIDPRNYWGDEARDFTPWLAEEENIKFLGDVIGIDLAVEGVEENVGPFRADILCKDTVTDRNVLIENQLYKTDHVHLGQIITYAAGLDAVTIIWIATEFSEQHRAALDWLNRVTTENIHFFGIEIELFKIGNSPLAPKFNIVSKPNDWTKTISPSKEVTETKQLQLEYWTKLKVYIETIGSPLKCQKPLPQHWYTFSVGRSSFYLMAFANTRDNCYGVTLIMHGTTGKENFKKLKELYEEESYTVISGQLEWKELPGKKESHVNLSKDGEIAVKENWNEQHAWLKLHLEKFYNYFSPKIKSL